MPKHNYRDYTVEQFMLQPSFIAWSLQSDPESVAFWNDWLAEHPDCRPTLEQARLMTIALRERYRQAMPEDAFSENIAALMQQLAAPDPLPAPFFRRWVGRRWAIAASLTGLLLLAISWYLLSPANPALSARQWVEQTGGGETLEKNHTQPGLSTVVLSDGSTVTLEQGSQLIYPATFGSGQRKVYLQGEAFFEVAKNPAQPFLVYTGTSVVRVVGTSFRIKANAGQAPDQIAVRTGRVLVYRYRDFARAGSNERALAEKALVLLPNEQVLLDNDSSKKAPVQQAADVAAIIAPEELVYDDRPVTEVFQHLAGLYGVEIAYEQSAMARCNITSSFRDESLEERLRLICAAIGTEFRLENGKIEITGRPCR